MQPLAMPLLCIVIVVSTRRNRIPACPELGIGGEGVWYPFVVLSLAMGSLRILITDKKS